MIINKSQFNLLCDLTDEIKSQLKINIGYSCPFGTFIADEDEFILFEKDKFHLIHKLDLEREGEIFVFEKIADYPLHDDSCKKVLKLILESIENGNLVDNKSITKKFGEVKIEVIKLSDNRYSVWINREHSRTGYSKTIEELKESCIDNTSKVKDDKDLPEELKQRLINHIKNENSDTEKVLSLIKELENSLRS